MLIKIKKFNFNPRTRLNIAKIFFNCYIAVKFISEKITNLMQNDRLLGNKKLKHTVFV